MKYPVDRPEPPRAATFDDAPVDGASRSQRDP
jgi:hypothetical protein